MENMKDKAPVGKKWVMEVALCVFAEVSNVAQLWQESHNKRYCLTCLINEAQTGRISQKIILLQNA